MRYCPPIYVLCVSSHLWTVPRQIKFWAILIKSWDWRDPPPLLGQNPKFTQKNYWTAPLIASDGHHLIVCLTWPEKKHRHILIFYAEQDWPRPKALPDDTKARPHSSILTTTALNIVNSGLIRGSNVFVEIFGWRKKRVCRQTVHKASFGSLFSSDILVNNIRPCKTSDTQHNG